MYYDPLVHMLNFSMLHLAKFVVNTFITVVDGEI